MCSRRRLGFGAAILAMSILLPHPAVRAQDAAEKTIRIGLVGSLFHDVPSALAMAMMQPFAILMKTQTGMTGKLSPGGDPYEVARALAEDKYDLAVFHGIEFAWVQLKYPELRPLMIAVNQKQNFRVHLVVRADIDDATLADLKGSKLALPRGTREHTRIFLERACQDLGSKSTSFFGKITVPSTIEDALDDVVDDEVQAAIVESVPLESFAQRKPARAARLKTLVASEIFPSGVVAYRPGALDEETIERFREGMVNANKNSLGKQLLSYWRLTGFAPIPEDYEAILTNIVKHYPPPGPPADSK